MSDSTENSDYPTHRTHPSELSDRELLERIANKDPDKYGLPEIAQKALERLEAQEDSS